MPINTTLSMSVKLLPHLLSVDNFFQTGKQNYVSIGPFSKQRNLFGCLASVSMVFLSNGNDKSTYTKVENHFNV